MQYTAQQLRTGLALGVIANIIWGVSALYWVETAPVSPADVVAHRAIWSLPVAALVLLWAGRFRATWALVRVPKTLLWSAAGTILLSLNWGVFVYAVFSGRATEASLGYFMVPLLTIMVGKVVFHETLGPAQRVAIVLAVMAVALQLVSFGSLPWISLVVGTSFPLYAAIRKKIEADTMQGLFIETLCMAPFALSMVVDDGRCWDGSARLKGRCIPVARGCLYRDAPADLYCGVAAVTAEYRWLDLLSRTVASALGSANGAGRVH